MMNGAGGAPKSRAAASGRRVDTGNRPLRTSYRNVGVTGNKTAHPRFNATSRTEKRWRIAVTNPPDAKTNCLGGGSGDTTVEGYLFNLKAFTATVDEGEKEVPKSGAALYFVDRSGTTFRVNIFYKSYFYADVSDCLSSLHQHESHTASLSLLQNVQRFCADNAKDTVEIDYASKIDLSRPGHIAKHTPNKDSVYALREFLKFTFENVDDLKTVKMALQRRIDLNYKTFKSIRRRVLQATGRRMDDDDLSRIDRTTVLSELRQEPLLALGKLYEADVLYTTRVQIDCNIRCGQWYTIHNSTHAQNATVEMCEDQSETAPLRVLAWDIETYKEPLKFPSAQKDPIMCI
eukprot:Lankesteria_metandrocarpae@DN7453_c0_g1_i1.p1